MRAGALEDAFHRVVGQEFHDGRLQAFLALRRLVDLDVRETLRTVTRDIGGVVVDLRAWHGAAAGHAQRGHAAFGIFRRAGEHFEVAAGDEVRHVDQLERVAQVGLVGTVSGAWLRHKPCAGRDWPAQRQCRP